MRFIRALCLIGTALLALPLAACATVPNPIRQNEVYGGVAVYGVAQTAIEAYGHLPYCAKGTTTSATNYCQDPAIEVQLAKANGAVSVARKALEAFVRNPANYPGLTYSQLFQTYQQAQAALSQIAAEYGVH
jgi:hypothetical protein